MISKELVVSLRNHDLGFRPDVDEKTLESGIKQCQAFILLVISEGGTAAELLNSKVLLPDLDRDGYRNAMENAIAVSLSVGNPDYKVIITWAAETLDRQDRRKITRRMENFYTGILHNFENLSKYPLDDYSIFESRQFLSNFNEFHNVDEKTRLMDYIAFDNPAMAQRIAATLEESKAGLELTYLQLQAYETTKNVRRQLHGTTELSFDEIHEKLLGLFSIADRTPIQQGFGVTFNPVWDPGLLQLPKVKSYLEAVGFDFLRELSSLALRPQNIIEAHYNHHRLSQCELASELTEKLNLSVRQAAELFYCGIMGHGIGKVMDLQSQGETEFLGRLAIDLCNYEEDRVDYVSAMVASALKSLPSAKVIKEICKLENEIADSTLAKMYEKTSDKSILPHLKSFSVKGNIFAMELGV